MEGNRIVYRVEGLPEDPVFAMLGLAGGRLRKLGGVEEAVVSEVGEKLERSPR